MKHMAEQVIGSEMLTGACKSSGTESTATNKNQYFQWPKSLYKMLRI